MVGEIAIIETALTTLAGKPDPAYEMARLGIINLGGSPDMEEQYMAERIDVHTELPRNERAAQIEALTESELLMFREAALIELSRLESEVHFTNTLLNRKGYGIRPFEGVNVE